MEICSEWIHMLGNDCLLCWSPHTGMNHKRSCLFPSVCLRWRCSNWFVIIESLWNVSKLIWGPMHKALVCGAYFHWHVVFSIKSSSCLSCVTSRQYYCVVHSKVSFTRREQLDFCFHCSRCALVYKDLFQSGVINGNSSLFWTKQMRRWWITSTHTGKKQMLCPRWDFFEKQRRKRSEAIISSL